MKYNITETTIDPKMKQKIQGWTSTKSLSMMGNDNQYKSYQSILNPKDEYMNYTIEVMNIPLSIDHKSNLYQGMEYLLEHNVVVSREDYLNEYQTFQDTFRLSLDTKQKVQMSKVSMSKDEGEKQYLNGWKQHLMSYIEPDKVGETTNSVDTTEMFLDIDNYILEMSGSVE